MLAVKQEHEMVVSAPSNRCAFCGDEHALRFNIHDGHISYQEGILPKSSDIRVCPECLATDDIVDRIRKAQEQLPKSEEPRCVLCEGEDAKGYRISEKGIDLAFEVEADCFLCRECIERDDFEDQLRAYLERRGIYVDWLHNFDKPKEKLDCQLPIRMSKVTREKLEVAAKAHGVTLNKLVNSLIEGGLKFLPLKPPAG